MNAADLLDRLDNADPALDAYRCVPAAETARLLRKALAGDLVIDPATHRRRRPVNGRRVYTPDTIRPHLLAVTPDPTRDTVVVTPVGLTLGGDT